MQIGEHHQTELETIGHPSNEDEEYSISWIPWQEFAVSAIR
jgi:hypothetical protein